MQNEVYGEDFEKFLSTLEVLYVEDEDRVRAILEKRLSREFGKVYTAQNGEVGLYKFDTHRPKVVISDIRMPVMDGLEMLSHIKEKAPRTKVVITTAHSDASFMMKSIEIGIDRYILKPINVDEFISSIKKICFGLYNEQLATEYHRTNIGDQLNDVVKGVFEQMSQAMPNPMTLFQDGKPLFMNKAFTELFDAQTVGSITSGELDIEEVLSGISSKKTEITLPSGRKKIFLVHRTPITIDRTTGATLYTLNDQTALEYQNVKLKNYADILYELLKVRNCRVQLHAAKHDHAIDHKTEVVAEETSKDEPIVASLSNLISEEEMRALKKSRSVKTTAEAYIRELDEDTLDDLDELREIESEIAYLLDEMEDGDFTRTALKLGTKFIAYSHIVGRMLEFSDLAIAIRNLGAFLSEDRDLDYVKWSKIFTFSQNIKMDLANWRNKIFVEKSALDIHYLDSSLMSSCIQIQLYASDQEIELDDENDLELF